MTWIIKSFNRPQQCGRLIEQLKATGMTTPGVLIVNGCEMADAYRQIALPDNWETVWIEQNIGTCAPLNQYFDSHPFEPWYGVIDDDEWVTTPEWDKKLIEAAGSWNVAHGDDGWQSEARLHGFVTIGGELMRAVGYYCIPGLWHWYGEAMWEMLAKEIPFRRFTPEVRTEHRHWINNRAPVDPTYISGQSRRREDLVVFQNWLNTDFPAAVQRIKAKRPDEA